MLSRISLSESHIIFICIFAGNVKPVQISTNDEIDQNDVFLPLGLDGFVAHVFSTKSKAGNEFFEVKFKIAEVTCVTIRIIKQANQTTTEIYLRRLNQEGEPVTFNKFFKKLLRLFFNTSKGSVIQKSALVDFNYNEKHFQKGEFIRAQNLEIFVVMGWIKFRPGKKTFQSPAKTNSLCEAILFDHISDIGIPILGELTQSIEEGRKYEFHNLNLKNFFGKKHQQHLLQLQSYLTK